jgi:hypothetical protein
MYTHKQALRLYRAYGVRVPVALGAGARTTKAVLQRSVRGLASAQAYVGYKPLPAFILAQLGTTNAALQLAAERAAYSAGSYTPQRSIA